MVSYWDAIALAVVIGLVLVLALPKQVLYILNGIVLITFGVLPLLLYYDVLQFDIYSYPITKYIILFVVITAGRELFKEGIKEENLAMKIPSIALGLVIIILTAIPVLATSKAISFSMPTYAPVIDCVIYLAAGVLLLAGMSKGDAA